MKKRLLLICFVLVSLITKAQTPQFYNSSVGSIVNAYPLSDVANKKAQWIFGPNQFNAGGTGIGAATYFGNITKIFLKLGNQVSPSAMYSNFTISLSQNVGTMTTFGSGVAGSAYNFVSGMTTVFYQPSGYTLPGATVDAWYGFDLAGSFPYNPNLSLVVEIKVSGGTGNRISLLNNAPQARLFGTYSSSVGQVGFGAPNFGINMIPTPLPALVANFYGYKENSGDKLNWSTSSELNHAYFNLQHSSDGINFSTIAKVDSKAPNGNSSTPLDYELINAKPFLGSNYYRLEQVNIDGKATFEANIVQIDRNAENTISIYPNPTKGEVKVSIYSNKVSNIFIKMTDMNGRVVKQIKSNVKEGLNAIPIDLSVLSQGMYLVQVIERDKVTFEEKIRKE